MSIDWATVGNIALSVTNFIGISAMIAVVFYSHQKHVAVLKEQQEILKQSHNIKIRELQKQTSQELIEVLRRREEEIKIVIQDRDKLLDSQTQRYEAKIKEQEEKILQSHEKIGELKSRLELLELAEDKWMGRLWKPDRDT